jgi:hypothetical protein
MVFSSVLLSAGFLKSLLFRRRFDDLYQKKSTISEVRSEGYGGKPDCCACLFLNSQFVSAGMRFCYQISWNIA